MSGLLCKGNVRLAYVDSDGVPTGQYIGILNAVKLALNKPAPDLKQRVSKQNDSYGEALDQVESPKPTECSLSVDDAGDAEVLAWALGGTKAGFTQAAETSKAVTLTAVAKDQWSDLGYRKVSNVVVKDSTDVTTYVAGTDYLLDAAAGFVKVTKGGGIADAAEIHVTLDAAALTGEAVSVGTRQSISVRVDGDMRNIATGEQIRILIPRAKLSAQGELDFMGEDFLVTELSGTALALPGQPSATVTRIDA